MLFKYAIIAIFLLGTLTSRQLAAAAKSKVFIIKTNDRAAGVTTLMKARPLPDLRGKKVIIKANFNSDDPFPATTHLETLKAIIEALKAAAPASITIVERSGMGDTEKVLNDRGVYALARKENVSVLNLDQLPKDGWVRQGEAGTHWKRGFLVPRTVLEADYIVNTCCLKTHRFGGDFTMALKNNVGLAAKWEAPYNYMWELHLSRSQRKMIAEINKYVRNDLVIMDGLQGFSSGGPDKGKLIEPGIILLSTDRVAIDAAGVAVLRSFGTTKKVGQGKIFDQDQLNRAAELGLGAKSPADVELVAVNPAAEPVVLEIERQFKL